MNDGFEQVGRRVRFLIKKHGVSQRQLGDAIGVDAPRLSKLLSGQDPFTIEYADLIVQFLGETEEELAYLHALNNLHKWQSRLEKLIASDEVRRIGAASEHLAAYLIALVKDLAEAERSVDPTIDLARLQSKHLHTLNIVMAGVVTALNEDGTLIFNEANIVTHLRFPANYYVAALLNLTDNDLPGGTEFGHEVQRLIDEAAEAGTGWTFLGRVIRQHAHHVNARYSRIGIERDEFIGLGRSDDIHHKRMFLIGAALRNGAPESAWSNLFDALQDEKDDFRNAVLAFDTCHYGDNVIEKDGMRPNPTQIRRTALRYFAGLLLPDPNQQLFAAKRLLTLLNHATPNMVREARLGAEAQRVAAATSEYRPAEADHSLNLIKRIDDEK